MATLLRNSSLSRRAFLKRSGTAGLGIASLHGLGLLQSRLRAAPTATAGAELVCRIKDPEIRAGVEAAIRKNLLSAATERQYPGHFTISADGSAYGSDSTWPGLDSWQMTGAYLLLGRTRLVLDYFEFVRASQRKDGNIPFAIFSGDTRPDTTWLRGLKHPDDVFTYAPPVREGLPESSRATRAWIGLFEHWQPKAQPLTTLAPVCYLLTAAEIYAATRSGPWLRERLGSLEAAASFLLSRKAANGLISGSGFYIELPPRYGFDGITQCYVIHALRELATLCRAAGEKRKSLVWTREADSLAQRFVAAFWSKDHFAEYVHVERGLVDSHGLSDVNWAALAFGVGTRSNEKLLWRRLMGEPGFWAGEMPTQLVTKPFTYETWELNEPLPFAVPGVKDVAAMGRVWQLETGACRRMKARERLLESTRLVCRAATQGDGYWWERYQLQTDGSVKPAGAGKYCEYAAVLLRVVFANRGIFCG